MTAAAAPSRFRRSRRDRGGDDTGVPARRWFTPWLLIAPGGLWLLIFFIVPLFSLGRLSLQSGGLSNYSTVISDNSTVIIRTFIYATISTIAAIIIGYPLAYVIATKGGKYKNFLLALVVLPFFVTYLVRTLSWKILLFDGGPVVGILHSLGILNENQGVLGSPFAVIAALTYNFLPFMVLPIYVSLEKLDRRLLDAAADLYSSPARAFRKVTLPLSLPGLFAGTLLTFIPAAGDFVNSELLGSERTVMIGNIIEKNFGKEFFRPELSALSFMLMAIILIGVIIYARLLGTEEIA
ncbi:MAG: ABC transporter permease [Actinobacteria bacterium]|nr:ABC transporter permease [Actinomycetota bacterium]